MDTSKGKRKALKLTISQNFGPSSLLHNRMLNTWTTRVCLGKHMTPRDHVFRVWTQWTCWGSNSFQFYNGICTVALPYKTLCPFLSHTRTKLTCWVDFWKTSSLQHTMFNIWVQRARSDIQKETTPRLHKKSFNIPRFHHVFPTTTRATYERNWHVKS